MRRKWAAVAATCAVVATAGVTALAMQGTSQAAVLPNGFKSVGYMPSWAGNVSSIQYSKLTHINYSFALPNSNGTLQAIENTSKLQQLVTLGHQNNVKVSLAIGGWNDGPAGLLHVLPAGRDGPGERQPGLRDGRRRAAVLQRHPDDQAKDPVGHGERRRHHELGALPGHHRLDLAGQRHLRGGHRRRYRADHPAADQPGRTDRPDHRHRRQVRRRQRRQLGQRAPRSGSRSPTAPCATRPATSAWTRPTTARRTSPGCRSGTVSPARTSAGSCRSGRTQGTDRIRTTITAPSSVTTAVTAYSVG
jgi:hypothetical protein